MPAPSQYEKAEATFFNLEFPDNAFHLRQPVFEPMPGTLDEAEIVSRLLEAMGELGDDDYSTLRFAARAGMTAFAMTFLSRMAVKPRMMKYIAPLLYRTLGPSLPRNMRMSAVVWGLCMMYLQSHPEPAKRAGFGGPLPLAANRLFKAMLESPSGVVYARSEYKESWQAVRRGGNRINLHIPELLEELRRALNEPPEKDADFPFILSAGERRSDTANTAVRDTDWHAKGIYGSLRISPQDATSIGCETGDTLRLSTGRASADVVVEVSDMMAPGHISLPNGTGLDYVGADGLRQQRGVAPNEFTDSFRRDFLAGTPWHKHIPARLEKTSP